VSHALRRFAPFLVLVVLCLTGAPGAVAAVLPGGPLISLAEMEFLAAPKGSAQEESKLFGRIATVDANGGGRQVLLGPSALGRVPIGAPTWSADGSEVAFAAGADEGPNRIFLADSDGTHLRPLTAAGKATGPVLSPDGRWLAFERTRMHTPRLSLKDPLKFASHLYFSSTTWIVPTTGGRARRITSWGNGRFASPSSFSPDGLLLALSVGSAGKPQTVEIVDAATGKVRRTEVEAADAAFSPDGSQIAFSSYRDHGSAPGFDGPVAMGELYVANADFTDARRITRTTDLDESSPSWDPGGDRLAYLRTPGAEDFLGLESEVVESNADGTCVKVVAKPMAVRKRADPAIQPPAWVPGPDRAAGPLSCRARRGRAR
jgi:Tol biopolymer transport system component